MVLDQLLGFVGDKYSFCLCSSSSSKTSTFQTSSVSTSIKSNFQMSGEIKDQNVAASTESNKEKVVLCRLSKLENLILKKQNLTVFP